MLPKPKVKVIQATDSASKPLPAEGMALLHIHGDKCMLHEARNASKGIKYVFGSDVVFAWGGAIVFELRRFGKFSSIMYNSCSNVFSCFADNWYM